MITVKYSCHYCKVVDAQCEVPARDTAEQDVREWMNRVLHIIALDHRSHYPECKTTHLANLKIPLVDLEGNEAEFIGQQLE